jgi:hypothetical protein
LSGRLSWAKDDRGNWSRRIAAVGKEAGRHKRQPKIIASASTLKGVGCACDKRAKELALWGRPACWWPWPKGGGDRHRYGAPEFWGPGVPGVLGDRWGSGALLCAFAEGE